MSVATEIAEEIRARIKAETGLTASAGVSYNKFLAKMAPDQRKPDGPLRHHAEAWAFVASLPVKKFYGVGPPTAERMHKLGIETGADLKSRDLAFLQQHFGRSGPYFYWIARGVDERHVKSDRVRKPIGLEDTFAADIHDFDTARPGLQPLIDKVWRYCEANGTHGKSVTLKAKWSISRRSHGPRPRRRRSRVPQNLPRS